MRGGLGGNVHEMWVNDISANDIESHVFFMPLWHHVRDQSARRGGGAADQQSLGLTEHTEFNSLYTTRLTGEHSSLNIYTHYSITIISSVG